MSRQIERNREALLSSGDVAAVEGVRLFGRRETCVLPDRPGLCRVHRRVGTAHERRDARIAIQEIEPRRILGRVDRFDRNAFRGQERGRRGGRRRTRNRRRGRLEGNLGEIGDQGHDGIRIGSWPLSDIDYG